MARLGGNTIPDEKQVLYALGYVHGIGLKTSAKILEKAGIDPTTRVKNMTDSELNNIRDIIRSDYLVEGELQRVVRSNIKRLIDIGSYKGSRHKSNLPVHGQRTRTNARTKRGKRIAVGGAQPKAADKT